MEFLSQQSVIHGDLAARNILLYDLENVKITDFGKAHRVNYDNIGIELKGYQPIAWMAIEAIHHK